MECISYLASANITGRYEERACWFIFRGFVAIALTPLYICVWGWLSLRGKTAKEIDRVLPKREMYRQQSDLEHEFVSKRGIFWTKVAGWAARSHADGHHLLLELSRVTGVVSPVLQRLARAAASKRVRGVEILDREQ